MRNTLIILSLTFCTCALPACSPGSFFSTEAGGAGLLGTALGSGVGWVIGEEVGNKTENIAINAAIGGGLGLLSGALLHERNIQIARKREVVMREARLASRNQRELDARRQRLYDATNWGQNEVKRWDERYWGEEAELPYQGPRQ